MSANISRPNDFSWAVQRTAKIVFHDLACRRQCCIDDRQEPYKMSVRTQVILKQASLSESGVLTHVGSEKALFMISGMKLGGIAGAQQSIWQLLCAVSARKKKAEIAPWAVPS